MAFILIRMGERMEKGDMKAFVKLLQEYGYSRGASKEIAKWYE